MSTNRDEFTGAWNREALLNYLGSEGLDRPREFLGQMLACIDIDNLKLFNAHNGHAVGDEVLKRFVAHVETMLDCDDRLYRHGGDSFVIVFAEGERTAIIHLLDQIRNFAKTDLSPPQAENCGDPQCRGPTALSVSIGVAELTSGISKASWLQKAEDYMYEAKRRGRDQICSEGQRAG